MSRPHFTGDLAALPTHAMGNRSLTWWGVIAFMVIEGAAFAMAIGAYFFLMAQEREWPPAPLRPPDLLPGVIFTIIILLSEIPNRWIKTRAEAEDLVAVQRGLVLMSAIGIPLFVLRGFEFAALNVHWTTNAYGSIVWALLVLHLTHVLTDWIDTCVLTALMFTAHGPSGRRFVDVSENCLYWRFVWATWLPIWLLVYWVPRWVA